MPSSPTGRQGKTVSTTGVVANLGVGMDDSTAVGRRFRAQVFPLVNGAGQDILVYVGFDPTTSATNYVHAFRPGDIWIEMADDSPRHGVDLRRWYFNPNTDGAGFTWGVD